MSKVNVGAMEELQELLADVQSPIATAKHLARVIVDYDGGLRGELDKLAVPLADITEMVERLNGLYADVTERR